MLTKIFKTFWLKWAKFGGKMINFKMQIIIWIIAHKCWIKLMFPYLYIFFNSLAHKSKKPSKVVHGQNYDDFSKMVENRQFFPFFQLVLNIFVRNVYCLKSLRCYYVINISKFYFGNQNFRSSKFWLIFGLYMKIKNARQQIPRGILCSIPCWKTTDLWIKLLARRTKIF
jgi:hypothetical protein